MRTKFFPYLVILLLFILGYSCKKDNAKADPILNISRADLEVGNDVGYTDTVLIQSNVDWTISVSDEAKAWLSVTPLERTAGDSMVVTIQVTAANTTSFQKATLNITPAGTNLEPRQINVTRKGYSLVWQKCYGGSDDDQGYEAAILPNGEFVTSGYSFSTDGDALGNTVFPVDWTLRVGSDGNKLWQKKVNPFDLQFRSIAASPDGGTVSLGFAGAVTNAPTNFYVVKFDANGNVVWNRSYGGSKAETPKKIISTADGGYLVSGDTYSMDGDVKANHGVTDLWVVKLDGNGDIVWERTFGGDNLDSYATVAACSDGGFIVFGFTQSNNNGDVGPNHGSLGQDWLVAKVDANGNKLWSRTLGGSALEISSAVIGDTDGGCILMGQANSKDGDLAGRTGSDIDTWVVKLTKDGEIGWQALLGGPGNGGGLSMVRLPNGNIAIAGSSDAKDRGLSYNGMMLDIWVAVINNRGKMLWQKTFGSSADDSNSGINAAADGTILVTNIVTGNDGDVSGNHGKRDVWMFKLK